MITFNEYQIMSWLNPLIWPFIRALALLSILPVFNRRNTPNSVKVGLAFFIALSIQPSIPTIPNINLGSSAAFMLVIQQIIIGFTLGFAVRLVFACIEYAGELIGMSMGLNFAGFFDPITATQGTVATNLFSFMMAWTFIVINGHLIMFQALTHSFNAFPVTASPFDFLSAVRPWEWGLEIFRLGFWIALPLITALLFLNILMGIVSKVAPAVQIFSVGLPFTLIVGLIGLWFLIPSLGRPFTYTLEKILTTMN